MTRAKAKTPARPRSQALSPALTRSGRKTKNLQSRLTEMLSSPGWTDASEALFKSPQPSPAVGKSRKTTTTTTSRSSVYRSLEVSKVVKTSKAPSRSNRRASVYQAASSTSPALTRSRRSSVYSKVFNSPLAGVTTVNKRRMTMATMEIVSSPPAAKVKVGRQRKFADFDFTALKAPSPVSPPSPASPAESEVTFNIKSPETPSPKARSKAKTSKAKKAASPAKKKVTPKKASGKSRSKERTKAAVKQTKIPSRTVAKSGDKEGTPKSSKSGERDTRSPSPSKQRKTPAKTTPQVSRTAKVTPKAQVKAKVTPKITPKAQVKAKVTPKVTPKDKKQNSKVTPKVTAKASAKVTPKSTPKVDSKIKVTPKTAKALRGSPRVEVKKTPVTAGKKVGVHMVTPGDGSGKLKKVYPKTPIRISQVASPKSPAYKTPTGASTPSKPSQMAPKIKSPAGKTPKRSVSASTISRTPKTPTRGSGKTPTRGSGKTHTRGAGKTPVKTVSSPALASGKKPMKKAAQLKMPAHVTIETPPKAAKLLGKMPGSKIKERKLTPGRTPSQGRQTRAGGLDEVSMFRTSTPMEVSRKRLADIPVSEIRVIKKKRGENMEEISTSVASFEKSEMYTEVGNKSVMAADLEPSNGWFGWCNIL